MCCLMCGRRLTDGVCTNDLCNCKGSQVKQTLLQGKLPFGQRGYTGARPTQGKPYRRQG